MTERGGKSFFHPATLWGIGGVLLLLGNAVYRLAPLALEPVMEHSMSAGQWAAYVGFAVFMVYSEGYKGFHKQFSPRVVGRAQVLATHPTGWFRLVAPLFCMALFHATRKRLIVSWIILVGVVCAIILVRFLEQPYRGIVDAGVVLGLGVGMLSVLYYTGRAALGHAPGTPLDLPVRDNTAEG